MAKKTPPTAVEAAPVGDLPIGATSTLSEPQAIEAVADNPAQAHAAWCAAQIRSGWSHGGVFSETDRTDPRLVAWELLDAAQR